MRRPSVARRAVLASVAVLAISRGLDRSGGSAARAPPPSRARSPVKAAMPPPPIMVKLIHDDAAGLNPDFGSYTNVDLEQGIARLHRLRTRYVRQRLRW